ncbi:LysM peptidoglycan-binding domain-containing protein [Iningainema tapete]|uniref:LysM peptidoglycan-binding domain-containing protein n=1 Tax=Iningainema tapete BLCC-T55 TaxID=2748662 RepID=A0A8J7BZB4_9CYAN|nr:LysM peptidoglycan-binding domain-containing protein [Iningainema tapete]MBD2777212.1 LysM peptidoglycan-binding domain-containing protein [Iningainema tapete BLCC-T55]
MTTQINCPVCGYTEIEGSNCPNCDTDISLLRMLQQLPHAEKPRQQVKIATWQLAAALLILVIGIGLGAIGCFLFLQPHVPRSTVNSPSPIAVSRPSPTPTPNPTFESVKPQQTSQSTHYIVKPGDSLSKIAEHFYGDNRLWTSLVKANPKLKSRENFLEVGEPLIVPNRKEASCGSF